jgi:hypothetical protein
MELRGNVTISRQRSLLLFIMYILLFCLLVFFFILGPPWRDRSSALFRPIGRGHARLELGRRQPRATSAAVQRRAGWLCLCVGACVDSNGSKMTKDRAIFCA